MKPVENPSHSLDRRRFVTRWAAVGATGLASGGLAPWSALADEQPSSTTRQAMGTRVGEVTDTSAVVWTRLTTAATRNATGAQLVGHVRRRDKLSVPDRVEQLAGACPGAAGKIRLRYGTREELADARETQWVEVSAASDFSHQFRLSDLKPDTTYYFASETSSPDGSSGQAAWRGRFTTAPAPSQSADVRFCVNTCLCFADLDHDDGFNIFPAIQRLDPKFVVFTGDNVYYDSEQPRATTIELARYHWQRMYSLPRHVELLRDVVSYWEKDDHDTHTDDGWPGAPPMGQFTFAEGKQVFREQVPFADSTYRTFRWGKDLQIWLSDSREFRSPNNMADGPEKTIWGSEQKAWLKRTLLASDATWKVLISPTPIVGPDRPSKNDNHSNAGFSHEGNEFRRWVQQNISGNFFAVCGDRHWQYHSVHPETGMHEFACGPASDVHAGGSPGYNPGYHRFHRVKGGFLTVEVERGKIAFRHYDVRGDVVYQWRPEK